MSAAAGRADLLKYAFRLEVLTVGWNVLEGVIAVTAALAANSVALLGFGLDSFVESASGMILMWRLTAEGDKSPTAIAALDERAHRLVGLTLFLLAGYICMDAILRLLAADRPEASPVGIVLTAVSLLVMQWLARAKRRAAAELDSRALLADSFQTSACFYLSLTVLCGIAVNALFGWWWADPVAALGMTYFLVREGREAWEGSDCCE